jgi:hypothetical protein
MFQIGHSSIISKIFLKFILFFEVDYLFLHIYIIYINYLHNFTCLCISNSDIIHIWTDHY